MVFLFLGYVGAAAGFYFLIAKTAVIEPELRVVTNPSHQVIASIELADQISRRAA